LQALDKCITLNDSYTKAYIKRGETYMTLEDYEEALKDFNHARDQSDLPGDVSLKLKIEEALKLYKKKPIKDLYKILNISRKAED
jgi:tetratricopeptide (TPR) repeat protein